MSKLVIYIHIVLTLHNILVSGWIDILACLLHYYSLL